MVYLYLINMACTDLHLTLSSSNSTPGFGETITITALVTNTGNSTESASVSFSGDSVEFYVSPNINVLPNETIPVSTTYTPANLGI